MKLTGNVKKGIIAGGVALAVTGSVTAFVKYKRKKMQESIIQQVDDELDIIDEEVEIVDAEEVKEETEEEEK